MSDPNHRFLPVGLTGKHVLVTAGANGIGRVIAEGFLAAGARVHVCDVDAEAVGAAAEHAPGLSASLADVSDPAAVDALFAVVMQKFGGLDILVNNAGIAGPTSGIAELDVAALRQTLAVDLEAMFLCARLAVPMMRRAGAGSVINLGSIAGRLSFAMRSPYSAAKWGVVGLTKSLALELGPDNIRVNAILPGHVNTPRFRNVVAAKAAAINLSIEEMEKKYLAPVALGRTVEREDIANMALYLCSPFGNAITGQAISVCGGVEMMA
jgi:NAD(P)-dependent dehydrogenase (short-subunit alcohol dehydrogenase family)